MKEILEQLAEMLNSNQELLNQYILRNTSRTEYLDDCKYILRTGSVVVKEDYETGIPVLKVDAWFDFGKTTGHRCITLL